MPRFGDNPHRFFASVYDAEAPWDIGGPQPALTELFAEFPLREPVLDVGSGTGDLAIWIASQGLNVLGVEFIPAAVARANERAEPCRTGSGTNIEFRAGDALRPAGFGRFGSIVDSGFYHLFEREQCEEFTVRIGESARTRRAILPSGFCC